MKRSSFMRVVVLSLTVLAPVLVLADEKEEKSACPMCPPSGERPMPGQMPEREMMRSMMERMMPGMMAEREGHRRMSMSPLELKEELKLTEAQMEALKPIETDYRKATIKKQADIRVGEIELAALLDRKKSDLGALKKKVKEIGDLQTDLMMYRVESLLKLREILTEEQHEKFKALLKQRMERFGGSGPMHGMGGGMMQ